MQQQVVLQYSPTLKHAVASEYLLCSRIGDSFDHTFCFRLFPGNSQTSGNPTFILPLAQGEAAAMLAEAAMPGTSMSSGFAFDQGSFCGASTLLYILTFDLSLLTVAEIHHTSGSVSTELNLAITKTGLWRSLVFRILQIHSSSQRTF